MPVPRQRLSQRRGRTRASHHGLAAITTVVCLNCKKPTLQHKACPSCGYYKGRNMTERKTAPTTRKPKTAKVATSDAAAKPAAVAETKSEDTKSTK